MKPPYVVVVLIFCINIHFVIINVGVPHASKNAIIKMGFALRRVFSSVESSPTFAAWLEWLANRAN